MDPRLLIRRINVTANRLKDENDAKRQQLASEQLSIFDDIETLDRERREEEASLQKEKQIQSAILEIKKKFGKNAILRGMNLMEGATAKDRNAQIGGHKA